MLQRRVHMQGEDEMNESFHLPGSLEKAEFLKE